jgi:hypothetical protein
VSRLVILMFVVLASWTDFAASAQEATPQSQDQSLDLVGIEGVQNSAVRNFMASGFRFVGTLRFGFLVAEFRDDGAASAAVPALAARTEHGLERTNRDAPGLRPASVRPLGDEAIAYAGQVNTEGEDEDFDTVTLAFIVVREGHYVHVLYGGALAGDPLIEIADIAEKILGRDPGGDETPVAADGLREGGLWDLLPRLADLPEGFVLDEERVPAPFDPLPGQAAAPTPAPTQFSSPGAAAPVGMRARIGDWAVAVERATLDATAVVQTYNRNNPAPAPGRQLVLVRLSLLYTGAEPRSPLEALEIGVVSERQIPYVEAAARSCALIPNRLPHTPVATGDLVEGNVCFEVPSEEVDSLVLFIEPRRVGDAARACYALCSDVRVGIGDHAHLKGRPGWA